MTRPGPRRVLRLTIVAAVAWGIAQSVIVGVLVESNRATAHRATDIAGALADATCPFNRDLAGLPITAQTGEIGRRLVRDAAAAYQRVCVPKYGLLPPVDPAAYSPAPPPPTSAPPPSRQATPTPTGTPTSPASSTPSLPPAASPSWRPTRSTHDGGPTLPDPGRPAPRPVPTATPAPAPGPTGAQVCIELPVLGLCIGDPQETTR